MFSQYEAAAQDWHLVLSTSFISGTCGSGESPGLVVAIAEDHGTTYWIRHDLKVFGPNDECSLGLSACSGYAFTEAQDCSPVHGTCTLMQTNDLNLGAPQHRSPGIFG